MEKYLSNYLSYFCQSNPNPTTPHYHIIELSNYHIK